MSLEVMKRDSLTFLPSPLAVFQERKLVKTRIDTGILPDEDFERDARR